MQNSMMASGVALDEVAFWTPVAASIECAGQGKQQHSISTSITLRELPPLQVHGKQNRLQATRKQTSEEPILIPSHTESHAADTDGEGEDGSGDDQDADDSRSDDTLPSAKALAASIAKAVPHSANSTVSGEAMTGPEPSISVPASPAASSPASSLATPPAIAQSRADEASRCHIESALYQVDLLSTCDAATCTIMSRLRSQASHSPCSAHLDDMNGGRDVDGIDGRPQWCEENAPTDNVSNGGVYHNAECYPFSPDSNTRGQEKDSRASGTDDNAEQSPRKRRKLGRSAAAAKRRRHGSTVSHYPNASTPSTLVGKPTSAHRIPSPPASCTLPRDGDIGAAVAQFSEWPLEDAMLKRLEKGDQKRSQSEIHQQLSNRFPGRSCWDLQVHYCTELERREEAVAAGNSDARRDLRETADINTSADAVTHHETQDSLQKARPDECMPTTQRPS
ncbi:hypothetical protein DL768_004246 [Monosporascus sp. mg162]|nr:hypothetical protein DL768_004246 [Monosporascus sp. mg162]